MAADITLLFRASVKTVKTRNKALGVSLPETDVLKRSRARGEFSGKTRDVINNIGKLKDFLLEHRKDYINACSHVSKYSRMTDGERDQIDQDAQTFMRACSEAIQHLRTEACKETISTQVKEHRLAVLDFIEDYLKRVCKLYSEQRAIRVKRMVDKKRLSRLEPEQVHKMKTSSLAETITLTDLEAKEEAKSPGEETTDRTAADAHSAPGVWDDGRGEDELSPEEIQMFEQENQRLVSEMNSLCDEVRQIEGKVVEISRLQEIFTEKVLQQETEIDNIHQLVVGATEDIKEGNEDIREAIKNNAGFRVWILFFLVMCSFSLLFLDWYDS
ncbi:syntaxin-18 [Bufo gargarizans]|uniref:syntaxin-18 n=1 Tax=Bufo gargarizans TaxID=30331 RepID=UPI001CF5B121|nr:syntaxin-18 [Bufo gargarizans]